MNSHLQRLELDKILTQVSNFCVLESAREKILFLLPTSDLEEAQRALDLTDEAYRLLFFLGAGKIEPFEKLTDSLERAQKGATLTCAEILLAARLLRSARILKRSVESVGGENIVLFRELVGNLMTDEKLERDIESMILNENELSDHASEKLYAIRTEIRSLNERIRSRLAEYLTSDDRKYLQEELVTMRSDRYVIPVKVEYKRNIKGFIHDRSQSGQTVFIEPEEVLEMNNELITLKMDEKEEIERILSLLSARIGKLRGELERNESILTEADTFYARAEFAHAFKCVKPALNRRGILDIRKGRHPLLDQKTAVPVSVSVGEKYSFLLISGANAGGKTVTLKMCGLFSLMAACGLFVPAEEGTRLSLFDGVYCYIGDNQSIEENLSTFSSHVLNLKEITERATENSLVLIDEPGGGTDPEEGQALARAVLSFLMRKKCRGIVTTHYSALKEYAFETEGIVNGCMEFDAESLRPLYRLRIGYPGPSNALLICSRLGLDERILAEARENLSEGAKAFEHTVRAAEESRIRADELRAETESIKKEWQEKLKKLEEEEGKFQKEREKFLSGARAESKRIVNESTARAEEIVEEIEKIFHQKELSEADLIRARTLKNKIYGSLSEEEQKKPRLLPVDPDKLKVGDLVFVAPMNAEGEVLSVKREKGVAEIQCGALKVQSKLKELYLTEPKEKRETDVRVVRDLKERTFSQHECNVIGLSANEALLEVENFLDTALVQNLETVRIVHGMGAGILRKAIHDYLKKHPHVKDFRLGVYGEGESGVTIVTLK